MSRFHVHLNVVDLDASVTFYSELFASAPSVRKSDYAKWMLEDPRVNFAISTVGREPGVDHLGIQAEDADELSSLGRRIVSAGATAIPEHAAVCCYAKSEKVWTEDPQGTRWETFVTHGESTTYYGAEAACATDGVACSPDPAAIAAMPKTAGATSSRSCCAPASGCC